MKNTTIKDCKIIQLPKFQEREKGNISFIENKNHIPFDVKRIFYLYDIPGGESRGAHSHYNCNQFLIAASGCPIHLILSNFSNSQTVIPKGTNVSFIRKKEIKNILVEEVIEDLNNKFDI